MSLDWILPLLVGVIASAVTVLTAWQAVRSRTVHSVLWSTGLGLWAFSAFAQAAAFLAGWNVPLYKAYYFAAIALAGFLGAGTIGFIVRRQRLVQGFTAYILAVTALFAVAILLAPVDVARLATPVVGGLALPSSVRLWTPFINVPGGFGFVGGAAYSYVRLRRPFALLITIGAAVPAVGGILARFALPQALPYTDFVGIAFLAAGIILSVRPSERLRMAPREISASDVSVPKD
jgi:hypothetical protein